VLTSELVVLSQSVNFQDTVLLSLNALGRCLDLGYAVC